MALPELLTKQVGPLPMGVWLLAVAGGLGISFASRRGGSAGPTAAAYLAANTNDEGEIGTPDMADVVLSPIFQLPEMPDRSGPATLIRVSESPEIPSYQLPAAPELAPIVAGPDFVQGDDGAGNAAAAAAAAARARAAAGAASRSARTAFINSHPELKERLGQRSELAKFLRNHPDIARVWARWGA